MNRLSEKKEFSPHKNNISAKYIYQLVLNTLPKHAIAKIDNFWLHSSHRKRSNLSLPEVRKKLMDMISVETTGQDTSAFSNLESKKTAVRFFEDVVKDIQCET